MAGVCPVTTVQAAVALATGGLPVHTSPPPKKNQNCQRLWLSFHFASPTSSLRAPLLSRMILSASCAATPAAVRPVRRSRLGVVRAQCSLNVPGRPAAVVTVAPAPEVPQQQPSTGLSAPVIGAVCVGVAAAAAVLYKRFQSRGSVSVKSILLTAIAWVADCGVPMQVAVWAGGPWLSGPGPGQEGYVHERCA